MTMEEYDAIVDQNSKVAVPLPRPDCEAICRKIIEESVRIVIPGRTEVRENFIAQAKELADYYAINTTVMEYEDRLTASFSVDSNCPTAQAVCPALGKMYFWMLLLNGASQNRATAPAMMTSWQIASKLSSTLTNLSAWWCAR